MLIKHILVTRMTTLPTDGSDSKGARVQLIQKEVTARIKLRTRDVGKYHLVRPLARAESSPSGRLSSLQRCSRAQRNGKSVSSTQTHQRWLLEESSVFHTFSPGNWACSGNALLWPRFVSLSASLIPMPLCHCDSYRQSPKNGGIKIVGKNVHCF